MLSEITRNKAILATLLFAVAAAFVAGAVFSTGVFQALLFSAMAVTGAILATFFLVALN